MATTIYRLQNGVRVPSVTTIINDVLAKPQLVGWANKLGLQGIRVNEYVDALADVGTAVHELCKADLGGRQPKLPPLSPEQLQQATNCYAKFITWRKEHNIEVVAVEKPMVSETLRYGGTPDCVARVDGQLGIIDFKTGKSVYDDHAYQAAGYDGLARENGLSTECAWIVRIGRDDDEGFDVVRWGRDMLDLYWSVFSGALQIYWAKKKIEKASIGG